MIKPTVGRVVNFWPSLYNSGGHPDIVRHSDDNGKCQPFAATVAYVWNDRLVNLSFVDHDGIPFNATSVQLLQDDDVGPATGFYAEWMDYQKGQAAKTEAAEVALKGAGNTPAAAPKFLPDFISSDVTYFVVADREGKLWRVNAITGKANAVEFAGVSRSSVQANATPPEPLQPAKERRQCR